MKASLLPQLIKSLPAMQETWLGKIPWRRAWKPTPVFLPGESHGQRSLVSQSGTGWKIGGRFRREGTYAYLWLYCCK